MFKYKVSIIHESGSAVWSGEVKANRKVEAIQYVLDTPETWTILENVVDDVVIRVEKVVARKGEELVVLTKNGRSYRGYVTMDLYDDSLNYLHLAVGEAQHVFHITDVEGIKRI